MDINLAVQYSIAMHTLSFGGYEKDPKHWVYLISQLHSNPDH